MPQLSEQQDNRVSDWPVYWFVRLEDAVNNGDFSKAAKASAELLRLGVRVSYIRGNPSIPEPSNGGPPRAA